jgi:hypothetical protein
LRNSAPNDGDGNAEHGLTVRPGAGKLSSDARVVYEIILRFIATEGEPTGPKRCNPNWTRRQEIRAEDRTVPLCCGAAHRAEAAVICSTRFGERYACADARTEQDEHTRICIHQGVHFMLRKISFALVTAAALGSAALVPAPASAHGFGGGWHGGGWGHRGISVGFGYGYGYGRGWCYWHPYACYRY